MRFFQCLVLLSACLVNAKDWWAAHGVKAKNSGRVNVTKHRKDFTLLDDPDADWEERAFVSLATTPGYMIQAIVMMESIRKAGTKAHRVLLYTDEAKDENDYVGMAELLNITTYKVAKVWLPPNMEDLLSVSRKAQRIAAFTKIRIWQLEMFKKIVYIDADCLIKHDIDHLFAQPGPSATPKRVSDDLSTLIVTYPDKEIYSGLQSLLNYKVLKAMDPARPLRSSKIALRYDRSHSDTVAAFHTGDMKVLEYYFKELGRPFKVLDRRLVYTMYKKHCDIYPNDGDKHIAPIVHFPTGVGNMTELAAFPPTFPEVELKRDTTQNALCQREWLDHWHQEWKDCVERSEKQFKENPNTVKERTKEELPELSHVPKDADAAMKLVLKAEKKRNMRAAEHERQHRLKEQRLKELQNSGKAAMHVHTEDAGDEDQELMAQLARLKAESAEIDSELPDDEV